MGQVFGITCPGDSKNRANHSRCSRPHRTRREMFRQVLAGLLLISCWLAGQQRPVAFVDVTVVPMDRERVLPHQTVVVDHGRIAAMSPTGKRIYRRCATDWTDAANSSCPDWRICMSISTSEGGLESCRTRTTRLYSSPTGSPPFAICGVTRAHLAFRKSIAQGTVIGPQIFTTGPITDGNPPIRPGKPQSSKPSLRPSRP